ncbi:MAG: hypothetical protein K9L32_02195 [Chromatiaceae bacterium]|nr:hypothetical protein [Chromatiaceae bacterium]
MNGKVQFVHAIDTEGPLYESLNMTFDRLHELHGISLQPSPENLSKLRRGEIDLGEKTALIADMLSHHRLSTLGSWDQIDEMLQKVTSNEYRLKVPDSNGNGWVFNWFCMDHVGVSVNPRRRDIGYHNIHDRYIELLASQPYSRDTIEWHFHPLSTYREAHRCATHYLRNDEVFQILARRIIDREFFPSCFRAGFHAERPDSHWLLEQFIPFDLSNMATTETTCMDNARDCKLGRLGNWRRAPADWTVYHPSHDDYQTPGNCRRLIGRALHVFNRMGNLTPVDVDLAFAKAGKGETVLLGVCSHDWRDLSMEIDYLHQLVKNAREKSPNVKFEYARVVDAFRPHVPRAHQDDAILNLEIELFPASRDDVPYLQIAVKQGKVFGPQPFLAIKTRSKQYIHDNLDFGSSAGLWFYPFYKDTIPLDDVKEIGIAANDFLGRSVVKRMSL